MDNDTPLPAVGVWHDHDGSAQCPLPVGTVHCWMDRFRNGWNHVLVNEDSNWSDVTRYLVHSYPENHHV